jgi:hypothetical protein
VGFAATTLCVASQRLFIVVVVVVVVYFVIDSVRKRLHTPSYISSLNRFEATRLTRNTNTCISL